jgi:hypothetical protein
MGDRVVGIGVAVPLHYQQLRFDVGALVATHSCCKHRTDFVPGFSPDDRRCTKQSTPDLPRGGGRGAQAIRDPRHFMGLEVRNHCRKAKFAKSILDIHVRDLTILSLTRESSSGDSLANRLAPDPRRRPRRSESGTVWQIVSPPIHGIGPVVPIASP